MPDTTAEQLSEDQRRNIARILTARKPRITGPAESDVIAAVAAFDGPVTALAVRDLLYLDGFTERSASLAIQRACDPGGPVEVKKDWSLALRKHLEAQDG